MVRKFRYRFKSFVVASLCVVRKFLISAALIYVAKYMENSGHVAPMQRRLKDARKPNKVHFPLAEVLVYVLLNIIDGNKRISQFAKSATLI